MTSQNEPPLAKNCFKWILPFCPRPNINCHVWTPCSVTYNFVRRLIKEKSNKLTKYWLTQLNKFQRNTRKKNSSYLMFECSHCCCFRYFIDALSNFSNRYKKSTYHFSFSNTSWQLTQILTKQWVFRLLRNIFLFEKWYSKIFERFFRRIRDFLISGTGSFFIEGITCFRNVGKSFISEFWKKVNL